MSALASGPCSGWHTSLLGYRTGQIAEMTHAASDFSSFSCSMHLYARHVCLECIKETIRQQVLEGLLVVWAGGAIGQAGTS